MQYLRVKNWENFQHYKDRSPPWIKLHRDLLRDYDFACLQDASKLHLILIWLLASQMDNQIPADANFIKNQIGVKGEINFKELIYKGFLIDDSNALASCKQHAMPETETETETEEEPPIIPQDKKPDLGMKTVSQETEKTKAHLPSVVNHTLPVPIATRSKVVKSAPKEPRYRDDPEFMRFWEQYPRKRRGDPHAAYKTWQELILAKEAHPEDILRGCLIYANSPEGSGDYSQGCQRWLSDYGWMKNYATQGDPYAKYNPVRAMLNLQDTGGDLKEGIDYLVICGERVLI